MLKLRKHRGPSDLGPVQVVLGGALLGLGLYAMIVAACL